MYRNQHVRTTLKIYKSQIPDKNFYPVTCLFVWFPHSIPCKVVKRAPTHIQITKPSIFKSFLVGLLKINSERSLAAPCLFPPANWQDLSSALLSRSRSGAVSQNIAPRPWQQQSREDPLVCALSLRNLELIWRKNVAGRRWILKEARFSWNFAVTGCIAFVFGYN